MIPAAVGLAILACLALVNYRLGGSVLYPPAHFSLIWAALLGVSLFTVESIFPLSADAVAVFALGAVAFSAGGAIRLAIEQRRPSRAVPPPEQPVMRAAVILMAAGLAGLVLLFPVFWRHLLSLADPRFSNPWLAIRAGAIAAAELQGQKPWQQALMDNATVAAVLLSLTAGATYGERGTSRLVAAGLGLVAIAYGLATGSRAAVSMVLLGSFGIQMMKRGRVSWRHAVAGVAAVVVMYVPITLLRANGAVLPGVSAGDVRVVSDTALLYSVGSLAAFDAYLANPSALPETWSIRYFFFRAANRFGLNVQAIPLHMGYVAVGQSGATNVYTMYFAYYPEFGIGGVMVLSAIVGYASVWLYRAAATRGWPYLILYGLAFNEICKSGFNEGFFMGLNVWVRAGAYCMALLLLRRISSLRAHTRSAGGPVVCCE